jgi:hypothetical protein
LDSWSTRAGNRSKKKGGDQGSVNSYAWVYTGLRDLAPYNVFHWSLGHQHAVVYAHLENYQGIVVGDGYGAYTQIEKQTSGRILHASCNTHYLDSGFIWSHNARRRAT